jgi:hypothetical protein
MNPKKKLRRCRGLGLDSGLDLAISRFIHSLACVHIINSVLPFTVSLEGGDVSYHLHPY